MDSPNHFPFARPPDSAPIWSAPHCASNGCQRPIVASLVGDHDPYRPLQAYNLPDHLCPGHGMIAALTEAIDPNASTAIDAAEAARAVTYAHQALVHFTRLPAPFYVYRLWGATTDIRESLLLYVGYSNNVTRRLHEHSKQQPWWHLVRGHTHEVFNTEAEARAAEAHAIKAERPLFNIAGRQGDPL